jgi:hypothetical protein
MVKGRGKPALPALVLTFGLIFGLGALIGSTWNSEEVGAATGMLTAGMAGGIALSRKTSRWFSGEVGPRWARAIVRVGTCAPLMFLGAAPLVDSSRHELYVPLVLALLVVALFGDWDKDREAGVRGELQFGGAIWRGFWAGVISAIAASGTFNHPELAFWMGGAVTAAVTLIIQANSWWLVGRRAPGRGVGAYAVATPPAVARENAGGAQPGASPAGPPPVPEAQQRSYDDADADSTEAAPSHTHGHEPQLRWGVTRAFWGLVAFVLMGGTVFAFLMALISRLEPIDRTSVIVGCIACFTGMIFALRKTTWTRRGGFWRDSLRPFLQTAFLFGIGAAITCIARSWSFTYDCWSGGDRKVVHGLPDEAFAGAITGLVLCSVALLIVTLLTGRKRRVHPSFVVDSPAGDGGPGTALEEPEVPRAAEPSEVVPAASPQPSGSRTGALPGHRGVSILVLGILGITVLPFLGIIAWVMANNDLPEMKAGRMDPSGLGITAAGRVCGIIAAVELCLLVVGGFVALLVLAL